MIAGISEFSVSFWKLTTMRPPVFSAHVNDDPVGILRRCLILIKLESLGYSVVKKLWRYVVSFRYNTGTWRRDGQTKFLYQYLASALLCRRAIKTDILGLFTNLASLAFANDSIFMENLWWTFVHPIMINILARKCALLDRTWRRGLARDTHPPTNTHVALRTLLVEQSPHSDIGYTC